MEPLLLGLGGMRCGSTSLFAELVRHPDIVSGPHKELHYFDVHWHQELPAQYWGQFSGSGVRLDITPEYLTCPLTPERVRTIAPEARFVVLLRNPVDRAYSHYWRRVYAHYEDLSFSAALNREDLRIQDGLNGMLRRGVYSHVPFTFGYRFQSDYATALARWLQCFPRERFFLERSEVFYADPTAVTDRILTWAGLPPLELPPPTGPFSREYPPMVPETRANLMESFAPMVHRLQDLLVGFSTAEWGF